MRTRPTVGLIVLDDTQRVLLFKVHDTSAVDIVRPDLTTWWGPPGGGLEGVETYETAGIRELWEETGLTVTHLGPSVATYDRTIRFPDDVVHFHIRYFTVAVPASDVDISHLLADERARYRAHRWWTLEQIEQSGERFLPPGLADLLRILVRGMVPPQPLALR